MAMYPEHDPLVIEYNHMRKRIEQGPRPDPMEIWEVMQALRAERMDSLADKLGREAAHILP